VATVSVEHRKIRIADLHQHVHLARASEERSRQQQLGQDDGGRKLITLRIELAAGYLLG
jgi:hypothetical protein